MKTEKQTGKSASPNAVRVNRHVKSYYKAQVKAYIPENLNLEEFLKKKPPDFKFHPDNFRHIISLISEIPAYNKDILKKNNFVPINSQKLQRKIRNYKKYLNYLIAHKIFETDNHYIPEKTSRGFRFTEDYQTTIKVEEIKKNSLLKVFSRSSVYDLRMERKYFHLRKWFNEKLKINSYAAEKYLIDQFKKEMKNGEKNAQLRFNANNLILNRLKEHDYFFKVDQNIRRLHTILTIMKSELRNFVTYDGQPLVSVDISNSQPFLSVALLNETFYTKDNSSSANASLVFSPQNFNIYTLSLSTTLFKPLFNKTFINSIISYIMLVKNAEKHTGVGFQPFIEAVKNGGLYKFIEEEYKSVTGIEIVDRKKLKETIFIVMFTDNRFIGQPDAEPKRIFRKIFPEIYFVFSMIKRKDSTTLPRLLQTIESKLMLDRIAKRIDAEKPEMPIFTVHDSIVCPKGQESWIASIMKEELRKAIGIEPTVKIEDWKPENLDLIK